MNAVPQHSGPVGGERPARAAVYTCETCHGTVSGHNAASM